MKRSFFIITYVIMFSAVFAQEQKPKLVVGIVVDQMRQDYLYRFADRFGDDGFRKLMDQGFMFKNFHYNYIPTKTACGHASIYTGTTPAIHGVLGNDWFDREKGQKIYCAADDQYQTVGSNSTRGQMSPKNLKSSTITDELLLYSQQRSKVLSLSLKDRSAIMPAGHGGNAFWYDRDNGNIITSTYYMNELPQWIRQFNERKLPDYFLKLTWNPLYELESYTASSPDLEASEKNIDGKMNGFPYDLSTLELDYEDIIATPFGNDLLTALVLSALDSTGFGKDNITDFLAISFSATDHVGHDSGPYSIEVEDTYLRLDKNIATIINKLDELVGKDNYIMFLTSDHAVAPIPQYLKDRKFVSGYFERDEQENLLESALVKKFGTGPWVLESYNEQIFLNREKINKSKTSIEEISEFVVNYLLDQDGIIEAYTALQVMQFTSSKNDIKGKLSRGYNVKGSGDVVYVMRPFWVVPNSKDATGHGSGFTYDDHVPLLWYGMGIKAGKSVKYHVITEIAPTISMMIDIALPGAAQDEPLYELFENR